MKVIFLDIDGVLNTGYRNGKKDKYGYAFDPAAVANLAHIIEKTGAEIVISSSWKCMGIDELRELWDFRGLPGRIIGITPNSISDELLLNADLDNMDIYNIRGQEIKEWLMLYGKEVSHYVIFDDMDDILPEQEEHFVWTDPNEGITEWDATKAIAILSTEPNKGFVSIIRELEKEKNKDRVKIRE